MAVVISALDYIVVIAMLATSAAIGVFFAYRAGRNQSSVDYFLGSRQMSLIPVSFSLAATIMSAITYLGTPAEVYVHGPMYGVGLITRLYVPLIVAYCFVPVYYRLKVTTMYEYLGMRFNNKVRYTVIVIKSLYEFLYMGIVIYTPALALSVATGISLPFSILSTGIICTFYTSIGGIKAVIWTDVFQAFSMLLGAIVMIIAGTVRYGGVAEGWRRMIEGDRGIHLNFSPDLTIRYTFWSNMLGPTLGWLANGAVSQSLIQRYNSCKTERDAKVASYLGMMGMAVIEALAIATGMTAFAYYYKCDPLTSGKISRADQIVPYFIIDLFHSYPGVPGIMIGGAFCASLSSMSSVLNGIVAAAGQDVVKSVWPNMSESRYSMTTKIISFAFGVMTVALAFVASFLGGVVKTIVTIGGMMRGPVFGVFVLGMFFPRANSEGAMCGLLGSFVIGLTQFIGSNVYSSPYRPPPLSVEGCMEFTNATSSMMTTPVAYTEVTSVSDRYGGIYASPSLYTPPPPTLHGPAFFTMSYLYISVMTTISCIVIGLIVSYITSWGNPRVVDPRHLTPLVARYSTNMRTYGEHSSEEENEYVTLKQV